MDRPALLAVPALVLAALTVPLRGLVAFEAARAAISPVVLLSLLSRVLWTLTAAVGFAAVGYVYGRRGGRAPSTRVFGVATVSAFFGAAVGYVYGRRGGRAPSARVFGVAAPSALLGAAVGGVLFPFGAAATAPGGPAVEYVVVGLYAALDGLLFGLLVVGGYALTLEPSR